MRYLIFLIGMTILPLLGQEHSIVRVGKAPIADKLPLIKLKGPDGKVPENPTEVRLGYNAENLYVSVICFEKDTQGISRKYHNPEEHDNRIWDDDCVDLSIAPFGDRQVFKLIVNSAGIVYDAVGADANWESKVHRAVQIKGDRWVVELAIPFESLGFAPKGGELWQINIGRLRQADKEQSSLGGGKGSFEAGMQTFQFEGNGDFILLAVNKNGRKYATGKFKKTGKYPVRIESFSGDSRIVELDRDFEVTDTGKEYHFAWQNVKNIKNLRIEIAGLYENTFTLPKAAKVNFRVWRPQNPLYEELAAEVPCPLPVLRWLHEKNIQEITSQALQYGFAFDPNIIFQELSESNNLIFESYGQLLKKQDFFQKLKLKTVTYPDYRGADVPATKGKAKFLGDPMAEDFYLNQVRDMAVNSAKYPLGAISYGDEIGDKTLRTLVTFHQEKQDYPLIRELDAKIRRDYGGGKWGIPESMFDKTPGRWMAVHRFISDQQTSLMSRAYQIVKEHAPSLPFVSDDPIGGAITPDLARWRGNFDIATVQLYPSRNPELADFAFNTKKLKDLTGAKDIRPCVHVEHYAANFTLPETLALMSQALIGGATGWHFYLADTIGARNGKKYLTGEYFGAPDRYQLLYNIAAHTPRLKYPEPDCAFFISQDTGWSMYGNRAATAEIAAFTMLGPHVGLWFDMINETSMKSNQLDHYRVIFISDAKYERSEAIERLEAYVRDGGILVVLDPDAFRRDNLDEDISAKSDELFGSKFSAAKGNRELVFEGCTYTLPTVYPSLEPVRETEMTARYGNGAPAITCRQLGKGRIYRFAFNPASMRLITHPEWRTFTEKFCKALKIRTKQDIWRFALPDSLIPKSVKPQGKCLTGNSIVWTMFMPDTSANLSQNGTYSWSRRPDHIGDHGLTGIPFAGGKLTDRAKAPAAGNVDKGHGAINDWIVKFDLAKPISLTFDLKSPQLIGRADLYLQGETPLVTVEASGDGDKWTEVVVTEKNNPTGRIKKLSLRLAPDLTARYLRLNLSGTSGEKSPAILAEVDLWDR